MQGPSLQPILHRISLSPENQLAKCQDRTSVTHPQQDQSETVNQRICMLVYCVEYVYHSSSYDCGMCVVTAFPDISGFINVFFRTEVAASISKSPPSTSSPTLSNLMAFFSHIIVASTSRFKVVFFSLSVAELSSSANKHVVVSPIFCVMPWTAFEKTESGC